MTDRFATALQDHLQLRKRILALTESVTPAQLDRVPAGFNNNLIWNAGHVIATQEQLTYALGGHPTPSGAAFVARYRRGTRPEGDLATEDYAYIRTELLAGNEKLREACDDLDWSGYRPYTTKLGVTVTDLLRAVEFNNVHEALHLGTMLAQRRLV
ncbi:DinB family protein [Lewinella sp. IMCC34183]|uniref:DinB family protein n=1 Tax=Lewinella sp. IMCC34183 TaxID=2248762 RepID=UPI000E253CD4|nr:DinB family protein [Lewinella sp. IMCC34183]